MRLFIAVAPDEPARGAIAEMHRDAERRLAGAARSFRWTRPENLHVTLHFLGDVAPERMDEVARELSPSVDVSAFVASLGRLGTFPERGGPRVIWLGIDRGAGQLSRVHSALADRLRRLDLPVEPRPFTPHFTLARARDRHTPRDVRRVLAEIRPPAAAWTVASAALYRSDLSGASPKYERVCAIPLS